MSGIENPGKACFVSSVLQQLCANKGIRVFFLEHAASGCQEERKDCLKCSVASIFQQVSSGPCNNVTGHHFIETLRLLNVNYNVPADPREFLTDLIRTKIPALQYFYYVNSHLEHMCHSCHYSHDSTSENDVFINIPNGSKSVKDGIKAIKQATCPDDYVCQSCQAKGTTTAVRKFTSHPDFLVIHNTGASFIPIDMVFDLDEENSYMLCGFIELRPKTSAKETNHYISYKMLSHHWIKYDDSHVERIRLNKRYRNYLLFYRKVGSTDQLEENFDPLVLPKSKLLTAFENRYGYALYSDPSKSAKSTEKTSTKTQEKVEPKGIKPFTEPGLPDKPKSRKNKDVTPKSTRSMRSGKSEEIQAQPDPQPVIPFEPDFSEGDVSGVEVETSIGKLLRSGKSVLETMLKKPTDDSVKAIGQTATKAKKGAKSSDEPKNSSSVQPKKLPRKPTQKQKQALKRLKTWANDMMEDVTPKKKPKEDKKKKYVLSGFKTVGIPKPGHKPKQSKPAKKDKTSKPKKVQDKADNNTSTQGTPQKPKQRSKSSSEPKKRTTSSTKRKVITVKSLGARNPRKDGRSKRKYKYVKYATKANTGFELHKSHLRVGDKTIVVNGQTVPGHCILCPKQKYLPTNNDAHTHYERVHHKSRIQINAIIYLKCKCSVLPNRGSDRSTRNTHYHCFGCFKPCDKKSQLAKHCIDKHSYKASTVEHLL